MGHHHDSRNLLANLALAVGSLLAVLLAAELALRFVLLRNLNPFQPDSTIGYRLKPSFDGAYPHVRVRTDANGHRVPTTQDVDSTGRYLFVGDSVTFGFSVRAEEAFPYLLGTRLGDPVAATNAGVPGYNLEQALTLLGENLQRVLPDFVVYGLVVNDVGSAAGRMRYEDIDPHAARSGRGGLFARSMLIAFVERRWRRLVSRFDAPEPEQTGANIVRDYEETFEVAARRAFDRQWAALEAIQRAFDVDVYVLICPFSYQVHEDQELNALQEFVQSRCESSELMCLDPLELFRRHNDEALFTPGSSYHFSRRGHAVLADWLYPRLAGK